MTTVRDIYLAVMKEIDVVPTEREISDFLKLLQDQLEQWTPR